MKLIFATGNAGKLREARDILSGIEVLCPKDLGIVDDVEETGTTLKENSIIKAEALYKATGLDCFADDTGLEVEALGGAPGIYSARYAGPGHDFDANISKLLAELDGQENRRARFRCVVTLILGGEKHFFEGVMNGRIALERSGTKGFGYDPVFIPDEAPDRTLAEAGEETKNAISHRGKSLREMARYLEELSR